MRVTITKKCIVMGKEYRRGDKLSLNSGLQGLVANGYAIRGWYPKESLPPPPPDPVPPKVGKNELEAMTVSELKARANYEGIIGFSRMKKAELIEVLSGG